MAKTIYGINGKAKELAQLIQKVGYRHSAWQVFEDFVEMASLSISNSVDILHRDEREKKYMDIVKRYSKDEINEFPRMYALLALEMETGVSDVLGELFHALELHNQYKGQFFTPFNVCTMMGKMTLGEHDKAIETKGYIGVCEPACGSGAMVLGFASAMKDNGYNYQQQMVVTATDIDLKCVHMCYLQLSLYHIPAVVIHGDSLAMNEWSRWYTPAYMLGGWMWRQSSGADDEAMEQENKPITADNKATQPNTAEIETPHENQEPDEEPLAVHENGQLSLF